MKTEEEVRRHCEALEKASKWPQCRCVDCFGNITAANVLRWVLGEPVKGRSTEAHEELVAEFNARNL